MVVPRHLGGDGPDQRGSREQCACCIHRHRGGAGVAGGGVIAAGALRRRRAIYARGRRAVGAQADELVHELRSPAGGALGGVFGTPL